MNRERRRTKDLDSPVLRGGCLNSAHVDRPFVDSSSVVTGDSLAGVPIERLAATWGVEAEQASAVGIGDLEGMRNPAWRAGNSTFADNVLRAVEVHADLALQDDHRFRRSPDGCATG